MRRKSGNILLKREKIDIHFFSVNALRNRNFKFMKFVEIANCNEAVQNRIHTACHYMQLQRNAIPVRKGKSSCDGQYLKMFPLSADLFQYRAPANKSHSNRCISFLNQILL